MKNLFKLEKGNKPKIKGAKDDTIKNIRNLFKLEKETKPIKDKIINDIRSLFEQEVDYYKPIRMSSFYSNNYMKYESDGDKDKNLLSEEHLIKIKPNLKEMIID